MVLVLGLLALMLPARMTAQTNKLGALHALPMHHIASPAPNLAHGVPLHNTSHSSLRALGSMQHIGHLIPLDGSRGTPPANDACANAQALTLNPPGGCPAGAVDGDNSAATHDGADPACDVTGTVFQDVWYSFNSGTYSQVEINIAPGTLVDLGVEFLQGGCAGTSIFCDYTALSYVVPVTAGTNYRVRITSNNDFGAGGTFTICLSGVGVTPPNDLCTDAVVQDLAIGSDIVITGDNTGATNTEGQPYATAWEAFTITDCADVTVNYCGTAPAFGNFFTSLAGDCPATTFTNAATSVDCGDGNISSTYPSLPAGTYYIPVLSEIGSEGPYTITLSAATCGNVIAPLNDECTGALPQLLTSGASITFTGDNTGCTDSEGLGFPNAWEGFTINECMNITWDFCGSDSSMLIYTNLFEGCPWNYFSISCGDAPSITCPDGVQTSYVANAQGVAPGTYYIVIPEVDIYGGPYQINVTGSACTAPVPANDECVNSIVMTPVNTCVPTLGTTEGATRSLPDMACGTVTGSADDDVWYKFVATTTGGSIFVTPTDSLDATVQLYSGTCGGLTPLNCADAYYGGVEEELVYSGLTVGSTYHYRVNSYDVGVHCSGDFSTCVVQDINTGIPAVADEQWAITEDATGDRLVIQDLLGSGPVDLTVMDALGRVVVQERASISKGASHTIALAGLASGSYRLLIAGAGDRMVRHFAVQR